MVLVIVIVVVLTLLGLHYSVGAALAVVGGIGLVSAEVATRLSFGAFPKDQ